MTLRLLRGTLFALLPISALHLHGQTAPPAAPQITSAPAAEAPVSLPAAQAWKLTDWPQLSRYQAENKAITGDSTGRVVFFGDSITDAWGRKLGSFFPGKPYVNRGISGQTTPQMVVRFRQDVINLHPAAVVILAGTNDIAGNTGPETPEQIQDNFRSMIDLAKSNGIRVIIASILPAAKYPWKPEAGSPALKIQSMNSWLAGYCINHGATWLDYYTAMADDNGGMKPALTLDGVHPNAAGYEVMAPLAQAAIDKTIGRR